jgi:transcriptional regulator with XRE-family HTH domain
VHTATHPPTTPPAPLMTGLGQALRWLRERQARKQYQVAGDAGITKGMLSAYETGRQRPSLETLDKLLETLGCDLNDLHNALQIVNGRPEQMKGWRLRGGPGPAEAGWLDERAPGLAPTPAGTVDPADHASGAHGPFGSGRAPWSGQIPLPPPWSLASSPLGSPFPPSAQIDEVHEPTRGRVIGDLYRLLGDDQATAAPLPPEEEMALAQMLEGFHSLLRYWHRCLAALRASAPPDPPATAP